MMRALDAAMAISRAPIAAARIIPNGTPA